MAVQLYKPGNTHVINGVECDILNCSITSIDGMIKQGWYTSTDFGEDAKSDEFKDAGDQASPEEIRALAKDAGIKDYSKKRISTLIKELEELTNNDD